MNETNLTNATREVEFVFRNSIYSLSAENNEIIVRDKNNEVCVQSSLQELQNREGAFSNLIVSVYSTFF